MAKSDQWAAQSFLPATKVTTELWPRHIQIPVQHEDHLEVLGYCTKKYPKKSTEKEQTEPKSTSYEEGDHLDELSLR